MKKLVMMVLGALLLASCTNDKEVDIAYQFTVKIDILDVVKGQKSIDNSDVFPSGRIDIADYNVRIKLFIYDNNGYLVQSDTKIVSDFAQVVTVVKSMPEGDYTVVATADIVESVNDRIDFEFWRFEGVNMLRDFKIKDLSYVGYEYKVLGISKKNVNISKSTDLNINVQPAGSLVTMWFRNAYVSSIAYIYFEWNKSSDYYLVNEDNSNVLIGGSNEEFEVESSYTGYYSQRYFLPVQNFTITWATYNAAIEIVESNNITLNLTRGVNPTITADVTTGNTQITNNARSGMVADVKNTKSVADFKLKSLVPQSLEVGSLPAMK